MSELTTEIAEELTAAAKAGAEEAAGALSRALDQEFALAVGESTAWDAEAMPEGLSGPGLAIVMSFGDSGAVALLPESSGLLPEWVPEPDPTGESKLATLAQELSMLLVPETLMADTFEAAWVDDVQAALDRGSLADSAAVLQIELTAGDKSGTLWMPWPLASPGKVLLSAQESNETTEPEQDEAPAEEPLPQTTTQPDEQSSRARIFDFSQLPPYSRSLLKVKVPVMVILASKKQRIDDVMRLGPGSILTFDRSCDAPIDVYVGNRLIGSGEAVKVGEKFGVKIREIDMPPEKFGAVRRTA